MGGSPHANERPRFYLQKIGRSEGEDWGFEPSGTERRLLRYRWTIRVARPKKSSDLPIFCEESPRDATGCQTATGTDDMTKKLQNFINGKKTDGATTRFQSVFNPALGSESSQVPMSTAEDVASAVAVAKKAFETWSATP